MWLYITALRLHARSDDIGRGMTSLRLDSTHSRMTSGVTCHHRLWEAHTVERRWAWYDINAFDQHLWSNDIGRDMPSPPLDNTLSKMTSGVACHHRHWAAHTVERRRAWHDITSLGLHAWSEVVGRGMTSPPLDSTHGRQRRVWHDITALGQHIRSEYFGRGMTSPPLDCTHDWTTSAVA